MPMWQSLSFSVRNRKIGADQNVISLVSPYYYISVSALSAAHTTTLHLAHLLLHTATSNGLHHLARVLKLL